MPTDPAHLRFVPAGKALAALLARVLRGEWRRARPFVLRGRVPPFTAFLERLTRALTKPLTAYYERGHGDERRRNLRQRRKTRTKAVGTLVTKEWVPLSPAPPDDAFAGRPTGAGGVFGGVVQAVGRAVRRIYDRVTGYVRRKLAKAVERERAKPAAAVPTSVSRPAVTVPPQPSAPRLPPDAVSEIGRAFDDRAARNIAGDEASRVHHEGQTDAAAEAGKATHRWLCSANACDVCRSFAAAGEVPVGQAFGVTKGGGAVFTPPGHPNCFCSLG